jgi:hypothetical protein
MHLILGLIGYYSEEDGEKYGYLIEEKNNRTVLTQDYLKSYFIENGYDESLFNNINLFCDNKNLKKCNIIADEDEIKKISVFTANNKSKKELVTFFEVHGTKFLIKPKEEEKDTLSNNELTELNRKSIELFQDEDFKRLLHIYKNKPDLLKTFYQYISSGDIIENTPTEEINVDTNFQVIKDMNLDFEESKIREALIKTGNHLNLSLRFLLFNS